MKICAVKGFVLFVLFREVKKKGMDGFFEEEKIGKLPVSSLTC